MAIFAGSLVNEGVSHIMFFRENISKFGIDRDNFCVHGVGQSGPVLLRRGADGCIVFMERVERRMFGEEQ